MWSFGLRRASFGPVAASDTSTAILLCTPDKHASTPVESEQSGLHWYWQIIFLCMAGALVISRQPEAFLHAQFYGEDGHVWFADAYNNGWFASLFRAYTGYFQTLPRLAAALAVVGPLIFAPLVMNVVGLVVQILPVPVLLSGRLSNWGSLRFRSALALTYLGMPNCMELNVTVTEAQWHLALVACLLVLAEVPRSTQWRLFDLAIFILCGLTGPFCILLLLIAVVLFYFRRHVWRRIVIAVLACTSTIQLGALLFANSPRSYPLPLGANIEGLARIIAGQVYLGTLLGSNALAKVGDTRFLVIVAIVGTGIVCYMVFRTRTEFRLFLLFSALVLVASLRSPLPGPPGSATTAWQVVAGEPAVHYWFFPTLAFSWGIVLLLVGPRRTDLSQAIATLLLPVLMMGIIRDWRHAAYEDQNFAHYADKVVASQPGEAVVIPETPPGWTLRLVKK
jgi:hypothetical protein